MKIFVLLLIVLNQSVSFSNEYSSFSSTQNSKNCINIRPKLSRTAPAPTSDTCYLLLKTKLHECEDAHQLTLEWGFNSNPGWIEHDSDTDYIVARCNAESSGTICAERGLRSNSTYYFAVRIANPVNGQKSKWSKFYKCQTGSNF